MCFQLSYLAQFLELLLRDLNDGPTDGCSEFASSLRMILTQQVLVFVALQLTMIFEAEREGPLIFVVLPMTHVANLLRSRHTPVSNWGRNESRPTWSQSADLHVYDITENLQRCFVPP